MKEYKASGKRSCKDLVRGSGREEDEEEKENGRWLDSNKRIRRESSRRAGRYETGVTGTLYLDSVTIDDPF